jgi:hypothetical protein
MLCFSLPLCKSLLTLISFSLIFPSYSEGFRGFEMFVDVSFTLDIVMNFFKLQDGENDLGRVRRNYLTGAFFFDIFAVMPGLVTLEAKDLNYFKLLRFIHLNRFFDQLNFFFDRVLFHALSFNRKKIERIVDFIKLQCFILLATHIIACAWIYVGRLSPESWVVASGRTGDDGATTFDLYF